MRSTVFLVLALAAFIVTLMLCAPLRLKVEDTLFPQKEPLQPWERVVFPAALRQVQFGMTAQQIKGGYAVAWTKQELGDVMLTCYPSPDMTTAFRFHFSGDSLYRVEVQLKPRPGQTREELYDLYRTQCAQLYARVPRRSQTRWSDGTVTAQIKLVGDGVELIFTCPDARH
jgi:hypothetical protein